jgi:hypothetical protein
MPDVVTLTLDPAGLSEGTHIDTVVITTPGASGSPANVPVRYTINPCEETVFAPDQVIDDSLTTSDCGAPPPQIGSFARVYTFSAGVSDTIITLHMDGDFDAYLFLLDGSDAVLAQNNDCPGSPPGGVACIEEFALPGSGTYKVVATSFQSGRTGGFTLRAVFPTPPLPPQSLGQFRSNGSTPIPAGGSTDETRVVFKATVSDPDPGDTLWLEVEARPGGGFSGSPTATGGPVLGGPVSATDSNLVDNTAYHWQARTVDQTGRASEWVLFGNDPDFVVDQAPESPAAPTGLGQFESNGSTPISNGGTTNEGVVVLKATVSDPDPADTLRLVVEVRPTGQVFTNTGTNASTGVLSGSEASVIVSGLLDDTDYHWQAWVIDNTGLGGASDSLPGTPDFSVAIPEPPNQPTGHDQYEPDSITVISPEDTVASDTVVFQAVVTDPDPGDQIRLQVEVKPLGAAFDGTPTATGAPVGSGSTAAVEVPALADDTDYHWQVRGIDSTDSTSTWVEFQGGGFAFRVEVPEPPNDPTGLNQFESDGSTPIPLGGSSDGTLVIFKATASDPDPGDQLTLEIEYQPVGTPFTDSFSVSQVCSADPCVAAGVGLASGQYHWQARVKDQSGLESGWVSFGTNPDDKDEVDFVIP